MDPVTHAMMGSLLGGLGLLKRKAALHVLVASSLLPDIDLVSRLLGPAALLKYHRGLTHSIFALLILPLAVAAFASKREKGKWFWHYYVLAALGTGVHIFMDLTTQYGVRLMYPLDNNFISLNVLFIIDLYLIAALVLYVVLTFKVKKWTRGLAWGILAGIMLYIGTRGLVRGQAEHFLRRSLERQAIKAVSPLPGGLMRWWFVAGDEDGGMRTGVVDLFLDRIYVHKTYPPNAYTPEMETSKELPGIRAFLEFSRFPYVSATQRGEDSVVIWEDLGFSYLPGEHFTAEAVIGADGLPISERLRM